MKHGPPDSLGVCGPRHLARAQQAQKMSSPGCLPSLSQGSHTSRQIGVLAPICTVLLSLSLSPCNVLYPSGCVSCWKPSSSTLEPQSRFPAVGTVPKPGCDLRRRAGEGVCPTETHLPPRTQSPTRWAPRLLSSLPVVSLGTELGHTSLKLLKGHPYSTQTQPTLPHTIPGGSLEGL